MTTKLSVEGMSCNGCEANVEEALKSVVGVTNATADHESGQVTVEGEAPSDDLVSAVEDAGYSAQA